MFRSAAFVSLAWRVVPALTLLNLATTESLAQWVLQMSPTDARLRGVSVSSPSVAWCSGANGTVLRTLDGGATWQRKTIPDTSDLDFRDIQAFDAGAAVVLSIGEGEKSRIYKTKDGGETWKLQYQNRHPKGFLDAIGFWDESHGLAFGDPVDGRFMILTTNDAGETWTQIASNAMPLALAGEGAFAASGTCLVTEGTSNAWFATGGAKKTRVFRSTDRGQTWTAHDTPVVAGTASAGIFSLAFHDANHGVVIGGDYRNPGRAERTAAWTSDGGITWTSSKGSMEYRSGVAYRADGFVPLMLAVGPTGTSRSKDEGRTWESLDQQGFHAISASGAAVWAVGEGGRIAKFVP